MLDTDLPGTNPDPEERLSRRDFLFGIAVATAVALPVLSAPARAARCQCCTPAWIPNL